MVLQVVATDHCCILFPLPLVAAWNHISVRQKLLKQCSSSRMVQTYMLWPEGLLCPPHSCKKTQRDWPEHRERWRGPWEGKCTGARPLSALVREEEQDECHYSPSGWPPAYCLHSCFHPNSHKQSSWGLQVGSGHHALMIPTDHFSLLQPSPHHITAQQLDDAIIHLNAWEEISQKPSVIWSRACLNVGRPQWVMI